MSMLIGGLAAKDCLTVNDVECIDTSFPDFTDLIDKVVVQ
jgi:3-phosphoshikimate 1-carboxyvinyltransferase